jgi:hypothetical protein
MTKDIKRVIEHILNVSQRMIVRELPLISEAIRKINAWILGIDYREVRRMDKENRESYDTAKVKELEEGISKITKGE